MKDISIKELRLNLADIATDVERGAQYRVIRRSKPSFYIMSTKMDVPEEWETVVDFTEGGKTDGMPIDDVIRVMKTYC